MTNRFAASVLVVLLPLAMGAGEVSTVAKLENSGKGEVSIRVETDSDELRALKGIPEGLLRNSFLVKLMVSSPGDLERLLQEQKFSDVSVRQSVKEGKIVTDATGRFSDVEVLAACGGKLALTRPSTYVHLKGNLGGALAGSGIDLSPVKDIKVKFTIEMPGTIRENQRDATAKINHTGQSATYEWTADRLLAESTDVSVQIVPDIEGSPFFWLALILGVAGLVVLGAVIILQQGRTAGNSQSEQQ